MVSKPLRISVSLTLLCLLLSACGKLSIGVANSNSAPDAAQSQAKDDLEELQGFVELPVDPDEVSWRESTMSASDASAAGKKEGTRRVVAVLRYEGSDAQKFSASVAGLGKGESVVVPIETWYPAELIAKGQTGNEETVRATAYAADGFAKPPFKRARLARVEGTDFYILELFSE